MFSHASHTGKTPLHEYVETFSSKDVGLYKNLCTTELKFILSEIKCGGNLDEYRNNISSDTNSESEMMIPDDNVAVFCDLEVEKDVKNTFSVQLQSEHIEMGIKVVRKKYQKIVNEFFKLLEYFIGIGVDLNKVVDKPFKVKEAERKAQNKMEEENAENLKAEQIYVEKRANNVEKDGEEIDLDNLILPDETHAS